MTSTSPYAYPSEFIESHSDDLRILPSTSSLLSTSFTTTTKNLAIDVIINQGLPDTDITESVKTDPKTNLIRDPAERNIPRLIVDENIIKQTVHIPPFPITNLHDQYIESNQILNNHINEDLHNKNKIESIKKSQQHQVIQIAEDKQPIDDYWKKEILIDDEGIVAIEPIKYDKNAYDGPFGLTRQGSFIFYIGMGIFTLLSAVFLIMTGVFYSENYPDSSTNSAKLAGMGICGFSFYLGLQLILIGLWHQKYRQENPTNKIIKRSTVHSNHLKSSMHNNQQYNYSYQQQIDYTNPSYISNKNEQILFQQPITQTTTDYSESVVWPSNVEVETQPDPKFFQPMEWSLGQQQQQQSTTNVTSSEAIHTSMSNPIDTKIKKIKHNPIKSIEVQPKTEFDNVYLNSSSIEQSLPVLSETNELIKSIAYMEQTTEKFSVNDDISSKKHNQIKPFNSNIYEIPLNDYNTSYNRHQHHHHHRHHSQHHHHHHHHHRRSPSTCSECSYSSHRDHHRHHHHHHHSHPVLFPRIITPRFPRILTPTPKQINTTVYRDAGVNTGNEIKLMRDSAVTVNLEDVPNTGDNRLEKIPIVRRTIIVEPYPAQPSQQIVVKPRADMIGKIRLGKNMKVNDNNETIIYPTTKFLTKKSKKKKKKTTMINNNIIEDLQLEDVNDDNDGSIKTKSSKISTTKTIKNAFYN